MKCILGLCILISVFAGNTALTGGTLDELLTDIQGQKDHVDKIVDYITNGEGHHATWDTLASWTDTFGGRLCGSQNLEDSIDDLKDSLEKEGFENVHTEDVKILNWTRGEESAYMTIGSRNKTMAITGLGTSVGTPAGGITAEVIVVHSFEELEKEGSNVMDKIVVYNQPWEGYGVSVAYRSHGASRAAKLGAVASLVRSMTPYSLYTLHTGVQTYEANVTKIPSAAITVEDAELMDRLVKRGENIIVHIEMGAENHDGEIFSRNLIADIKGTKHENEIVMFGGHLDSWDLAEGVQDDGIGIMLGIQILRIMKSLDLKPKRTMRFVGWTCEEFGVYGSTEYYETHKNSSENVILVMEADIGVFDPVGIGFSGNGLAMKLMEEVMKYLEPMKINGIMSGGKSSDSRPWIKDRVPSTPGVKLWPSRNYNSPEYEYFEYHHSTADSMTALDPNHLDKSQLIWTVVAYVISNIDYPNPIPLDGEYANPTIEEQILEYQDEAYRIFNHVTVGKGKNVFWNDLAWWTDTYWRRLCGSQDLEDSIDGLKSWLEDQGFSNVAKEPVNNLPRWERGHEHAKMTKPRIKKLDILGLGSSVSTPQGGITAEVLVVGSFDELHSKADKAEGKIVVFNQEWHGYGNTYKYRSLAAQKAVEVGARAVLVRSLASRSLGTPHTGIQNYGDLNETDYIPAASITVEDAEMLHRIYNRSTTIEIYLYMEAKTYPDSVTSHNLVAELPGHESPNEVVIIGGHLDNWDVGQGSMDDGSGVFNAIEVLKVVKALGLKPRRTLRFVGWTCEEIGGSRGGNKYYEDHKHESDNIIIAMENDHGTFMPQGIGFTGNAQAVEYMRHIMKLMSQVNATGLLEGEGRDSDTSMWSGSNVPLATYHSKGADDITYEYFRYHHTNADSMTMHDPAVLDMGSAMWTSIAYILADMKTPLPQGSDDNTATSAPLTSTNSPPASSTGFIFQVSYALVAVTAMFAWFSQ